MSENSQQNKGSDPPLPPIPVDLSWEALMGSNNNNEPSKKTWPELVGLPAGEAERKIKEEMAGATTLVVPADALVTTDYRIDRVRLYVDGAGKVVRPPRIG